MNKNIIFKNINKNINKNIKNEQKLTKSNFGVKE